LQTALLVARACSLAFLPPDAIPYSPYASGLRFLAQVEDPESLSGATVLRAGDDVLIACRGSSNFRNFRTNFDIGPVPLETKDGVKVAGGGKVHNGFQTAAQKLWRRLEPKLPRSARVIVTGHSLGGGTATLITLYALAQGIDASLVTVAGPRLGDDKFARHFRECCESPAVNLVHDQDDVIQSNQRLWDDLGFEHVGRVIRCDKDAPCLYDDAVEVCVSDYEYSSGPPSLRGVLVDHCMYMGIYIGVRLQHPSVWFRPL